MRASEQLRDAANTDTSAADDALFEDLPAKDVEDQPAVPHDSSEAGPTDTETATSGQQEDDEPDTQQVQQEAPVFVDGSKVMAVIEEALRPSPQAVVTPPAEHVVDVVEALEAEAAQLPPVHQLQSLDDTVAHVAEPPSEHVLDNAPARPPRVTASWLIEKNSSEDWGDFTVRLKQAESDAAAVQELVNEVHAAAQAEASTAQALAAKVIAAAKKLEEDYKVELQRQASAFDMQRAAELQLQADKMAVEHQAALRDTMQENAREVDGVREQLNTLSAAFSRRSEERRSSHNAHKLALASMALTTALENGGAFAEAITAMRSAAGNDAMVACVLDSLTATGAAQRGVPTAVELLQQFRGARQRLGELLMVPAGALGPATLLTAKVAGWLRVQAEEDVLSEAEGLIARGRLADAARLLESKAAGTAAEGQIVPIVQSLRVRETLQLASTALTGRARALTLSLA